MSCPACAQLFARKRTGRARQSSARAGAAPRRIKTQWGSMRTENARFSASASFALFERFGRLLAGTLQAFDRRGRIARFLGYLAVLVHDVGARGRVAVEATQQFARHFAILPLRAVFIGDIEQHEFG